MITVGYGDVIPINTQERIFIVNLHLIIIIISSIIQTLLYITKRSL